MQETQRACDHGWESVGVQHTTMDREGDRSSRQFHHCQGFSGLAGGMFWLLLNIVNVSEIRMSFRQSTS